MEILINTKTTAEVEIFLLSAGEKPPVYVQDKTLERGSVWLHPAAENSPAYLITRIKDTSAGALRKLGGECARTALKQKKSVCRLHLEGLDESAAPAVTEGFLLASYTFQKYKTEQEVLNTCILSLKTKTAKWLDKIKERVDAVNFTRDLVGTSPAEMYPLAFAQRIKERFAGTPVEVTVYSGKQLEEMNFTGLINVGRAGLHAPAMVALRYVTDPSLPLVALVGKGLTFDMGGMNVKTGKDVSDMRMDMAGAAAVCGAFDILSRGGKPKNVLGLALLAENLPDTNAMLPGEVLKYADGTTVHIVNTDAEGRLVLADGILYAKKAGASRIIDIATLTGSIGVALGLAVAGTFGDDAICKGLFAAGEKSGDRVWQLPLIKEYADELKSDYADMKNSCDTSYGGSIIAALFLKRFAGDTPWVHIDMAGTMSAKKSAGYNNAGPSGFGARLLADYLEEN